MKASLKIIKKAFVCYRHAKCNILQPFSLIYNSPYAVNSR